MRYPLLHGRQYGMVIVPPIFSFISIIMVVLRFLARRRAHRKPDASDCTLLIALVLSTAYSGLNMAECFIGGGGLHVSEIFALGGDIVTFQRIGLAVQVLWSTTVTFVKISILLLYCKIFTLAWFNWCARVVGFICIGYTLGTILSAFLVCQPLPFYWDTTIEGGHCGNQFLSYILTGSINISTDLMVLFGIVPLIRLNMPTSRKIGLIATFACASCTCITGILRLSEIIRVDFNDYTYSIANAMTYSALEPALAIILACVPTLRPLLPSRACTSKRIGAGSNSRKCKLPSSLVTIGGSGNPRPKARGEAEMEDSIQLDGDIEEENGDSQSKKQRVQRYI